MLNRIFSMKIAVIVMIVFAISIGVATFIENDYGTQTARALIYSAKWFELLLLYFTLLVAYNIVKYKMYKRQKWGQFILHFAFLLIAIGSLITRYIGYEGIMHIREGQTTNKMVSSDMMLKLSIKNGDKSYYYDKKLTLSSMTKNYFNTSVNVDNKKIDITLEEYLPSAKLDLKETKDGKPIIKLVVMGQNGRESILLKEGQSFDYGDFVIAFNAKDSFNKPVINLTLKNGKIYIDTPIEIKTKSMATLQDGKINSGTHELKQRMLYTIDNKSFVFKEFKEHAKESYVSDSLKSGGMNPQMILLKISSGNESKEVRLFGRKGEVGEPKEIKLNGLDIKLSYGAKIIHLPFSMKLNQFIIDRYPGSNAPSSYSSKVKVIDKNSSFNYHIYMNHVLDYKGYRFFQSSYDPDERGTILSVNHDPGVIPTYIGYLLLAIGFIWSFLSDKGRFKALLKKLRKIESKRGIQAVAIIAIFINIPLFANSVDTSLLKPKDIETIKKISKEHTDKFATLTIQSFTGRMEPQDTLSLDVVKKISGKRGFLGLDYNQIYLGILEYPDIYNKLRFIKIGHPLIAKKLGLSKDSKFASYEDIFDKNGEFKLQKDLAIAHKKRPAIQSKYEKELIKFEERVQVLFMTTQGALFKAFPKVNDPKNLWYSPGDAIKSFSSKDAQVVRYIISKYLQGIDIGVKEGNWTQADKMLKTIKGFQKFYGQKLLLNPTKTKIEILYNRIDIFTKLILAYVLIGFILLITAFIKILKPTINIKAVTNIATLALIITLLLHTIGLAVRGYIADHAPWSNAYESILYIAWATALAGFVFAKKSPLAFAATSILTGIFLLVAWISNLNPQITPLVPVLKSYWLIIHVAVITASYGFLGLGALLGIMNLILMIINKNQKDNNIYYAIKELTIITELSLLIGLAMVTVGNFLGGVWANESWGRYWSWDPKETWAAVTILVYAAILHMRFIPKLNSIYLFNVVSVLGYFSVIMTYFGVNYYLSGMHSYAAGDPVPIPTWVYFAVASIFVLIFTSYRYRINEKL